MPRTRPFGSRASFVAALFSGVLAASVALGGCTPGPDPRPTPTPIFTSEADAFKAAEKVYRAYIDTVNAEQDDPSADPQSFLVGTALDDDIRSERELRAAKRRITGQTSIAKYRSDEFDVKNQTVISTVCLDVSSTQLLDANGNDVTAKGRSPVVAIEATMAAISGSFKIMAMGPSREACT